MYFVKIMTFNMFKTIKNVNKIKAKPSKFFSLLSLITIVDHREWEGWVTQ